MDPKGETRAGQLTAIAVENDTMTAEEIGKMDRKALEELALRLLREAAAGRERESGESPVTNHHIDELRKRAEAATKVTRDQIRTMPPEKVLELFYELQVHQIELEMTIEELTRLQSELYRAHSASEFERRRLEAVLDATPQATVLVDSASHDVFYVNKAARELYDADYSGMSAENFAERIRARLPDGTPVLPGALSKDCLPGEGRTIYNQEMIVRRADGLDVPVLVSAAMVANHYDNPAWVVVTVIDITERKRLETDLRRRADDLASVNSELETFSYSVAHDLRNPLQVLTGLVHILIEDYSERLDPELQGYLSRIRSGTERMRSIIEDMLALAKISRQEIEPVEVDLSELARLSAGELAAANPGCRIEVKIEKGLKAKADVRLMSVAMGNLLGNAWKFSGRKEKPVIEFGSFTRNGQTVYFVRDNGAGFDMAFKDSLFKPFVRLHSDKDFKGTGVGLAIVERVISRHQGRIWATGEPGKGATFYFTLSSETGK